MPVAHSEFTFNLNVSVGSYPQAKPTKPYLIQYATQTLTLTDLERLEKQGKSFCYNFRDIDESGLVTQSQKTLNGFTYTNILFFDIDKMPCSMQDYISPIPYKPSLAYTTYSNGKNGKFGYRLLYAFDTPVTSIEDFDNLYYAIAAANGFKQRIYPEGDELEGTKYEFDYRKVNQQYYGGGLSSESYRTDLIYSISDFSSYFEEGVILKSEIDSKSISKKTKKSIKIEDSFPNENNIGKEQEESAYYPDLENPFYRDLFSMSPKDFISSHQEYLEVYHYSLSSPLQLSEDGRYWIYPDDYQEVKRSWKIGSNGKRSVHKWQIGSGRKKRMYVTAQIMRFNIPNITKEELIYNLVCERFYYYQNTDNNLNNKTLIHIVDSVLEHDFELSPCKHPKFSVNKERLEGNMTTNAVKNIIRKELKEKQVLSLYDFNLSVKENLQILKENGIKVSKSYLYDLRKRYEEKESFPNENNIGKEKKEIAYCSEMEKKEFIDSITIGDEFDDCDSWGNFVYEQELKVCQSIKHIQNRQSYLKASMI